MQVAEIKKIDHPNCVAGHVEEPELPYTADRNGNNTSMVLQLPYTHHMILTLHLSNTPADLESVGPG